MVDDVVKVRRARWLLWIGCVGLLTRPVIAWYSQGSDDIFIWQFFADTMSSHGVRYMYDSLPTFNHPPPMAYLAEAMRWLAKATGLAFAFCFKLPGILAEVGTAIVLWIAGSRLGGPRHGALAFALYAWSIDAILISGYHGNTDALVAFFSLLASMLVVDRRHDFAGGVALAAAMNVKLVPVLLVPALLAHQQSWVRARRFCVGLSLGVIPFVPILITSGMSFYHKAIAYNSNFDNWGFALALNWARRQPLLEPMAMPVADALIAVGRYLIVGAVVVTCVWARSRGQLRRYELPATCLAIFLVLTPGFGVQYTIWVAPFLLAVGLTWGAAYGLLSGTFVLLVYYQFLTHREPPFASVFQGGFPRPAADIGLMAWALLVAFVIAQFAGSRAGRRHKAASEPGPTTAVHPARPSPVDMAAADPPSR